MIPPALKWPAHDFQNSAVTCISAKTSKVQVIADCKTNLLKPFRSLEFCFNWSVSPSFNEISRLPLTSFCCCFHLFFYFFPAYRCSGCERWSNLWCCRNAWMLMRRFTLRSHGELDVHRIQDPQVARIWYEKMQNNQKHSGKNSQHVASTWPNLLSL